MRDYLEQLYFSINLWLARLSDTAEMWIVLAIFVLMLAGVTWIYFV